MSAVLEVGLHVSSSPGRDGLQGGEAEEGGQETGQAGRDILGELHQSEIFELSFRFVSRGWILSRNETALSPEMCFTLEIFSTEPTISV